MNTPGEIVEKYAPNWSRNYGSAFADEIAAYGDQCRRAGAEAMQEAAADRARWRAPRVRSSTANKSLRRYWPSPSHQQPQAGAKPMIRTALDELKMAATSLAMRAHTVTDENPNARNDERVSVTLGEVRDLANALLAFNAASLPSAAEAASPAAGWRTDMDAAPKDGTRVLVDNGNGPFIARWSNNADSDRFDWRGDDWGSLYSGLTRWTPLPPSAPSEEARAG